MGAALAAYLLGRAVLGPRIPAILPALVVALAAAGLTGAYGPPPQTFNLPEPMLTAPQFSLRAVVTAAPVMVVLITLQANVPSLVFLRSQDYDAPERVISVASGLGTLIGSLLGPMGVSLSLPATALSAGPDAGEARIRHRAVYLVGVAALGIGLLAGVAASLEETVPQVLLQAVVGLAVVGVLATALQELSGGPLTLGPMFAFVIALSELTLFGLGPFFWALVLGLAVSLLLEREAWQRLAASTGWGGQREDPAG